jgi:hypothetical protein
MDAENPTADLRPRRIDGNHFCCDDQSKLRGSEPGVGVGDTNSGVCGATVEDRRAVGTAYRRQHAIFPNPTSRIRNGRKRDIDVCFAIRIVQYL